MDGHERRATGKHLQGKSKRKREDERERGREREGEGERERGRGGEREARVSKASGPADISECELACELERVPSRYSARVRA